jgi:hypothetical protein
LTRALRRRIGVDPRLAVSPGERIAFSVTSDRLQLFDPETQQSIWE